MAENNISLKVFLRDNGTVEARRFTIDASVVTSYIFMKEKLQTVFPNLRDGVFKITWKDSEGDEITIASDEDIITALTEMNTDVKVLYVTLVQSNDKDCDIEIDVQVPPFQGPRIICDVCNQHVTGFRYKCMHCPDYDLCANCEHEGHHSEHLMMRVPNNDVYMPKSARKFVHHVVRNLKKSAYSASKEAHRAAKFAHKFGGHGKCGFETEPNRKDETQPSSSAQQPQEPSCPFASGDGINLNDIHALGALARQHFGPILEAVRNVPPQSGENTDGNGLFMDIIRNAVDGFFGGEVSNPPNNSQPEKQEPATTSAEQKETPKDEVPMDVEGAPVNQNNNKRDPGWTFVANKPQPEVANENGAQSTPTAPTFVYHENPKIAEGLVQLHEMGFSNESGYLTHLLERYEGNVNLVVKAIIDMKLH